MAVAIQTVYSREVERTTRYLKINDIRKAEHEIICHVQRSTFPEVIKMLPVLSTNGDGNSKAGKINLIGWIFDL